MNNQIYFEDLSFFQDYSQKDIKFQRNSSNDNYSCAFFENPYDNIYDMGSTKWNSCPNFAQLSRDKILSDNEEASDDNSSNLADTEENVPVENVRKTEKVKIELDTNEHSFDSIKFNDRDVNELVNMISKPNTDMNALLSEVLTSGPTDPKIKRKRAITSKAQGKRVRKSKEQIDILSKEYELNSEWTSEDIEGIASRLNLTKKQVYKWFWDTKISNGETKPKCW
jgi:hypothetical protein